MGNFLNLRVKSPGSGGELIQGTLSGTPFLVTCPIDLYAEAALSVQQNLGNHTKARLAQARTLAYLGYETAPCGILLHSALPQGKGLASSSADIAAVCQLTALSLGHELMSEEIAAIAVKIEPTDGVFCPGIVQFNHLNGMILKTWPHPPNLSLLLYDCGGAVDTLRFNRRGDLRQLNDAKEPDIREAIALLEQGFAKQDPLLIGAAATRSAFANQKILYKKQLANLHDIAMRCGAVGVNIAHSGTVIGMIFAGGQTREKLRAKEMMRQEYPEMLLLHDANLISGGLRIEKSDAARSL